MLTISDAAAEKGKQKLTAEGKADWGLRVYMAESSCCGPSFGMNVNEPLSVKPVCSLVSSK